MIGQHFLLIFLTTLIVSGVGMGGWTTPVPASAHERDVEDVSAFYEPLAPYGTWTTVEEHGQVWIPRGVPHGWRPYTDGRWVYTDVGWTWVSDWEWGWAPFHYGRWSHSHDYGWYWVPGTVWGPAWVTWRHTPGWVGWAPLPPRVGFHVGIGLGAAHINVDIAPHWFSFVEDRHILAPRVHTYIAPPTRNVHLVHVTKNVTNYVVINNRVVNRSVEVNRIERATRRPVVRHRLVEVDSPDRARGPRVRDREREVVLVRPAPGRERRDGDDREWHERRERHDNDRPDVAGIRDRRREREEQRRRHEELSNGRAAREERQRQERHNRRESITAEERRQQQRLRRERVQEQRREEHARTTAEQAQRDRRELRQRPSQERQQAPRPRITEDEERHRRARQQPPANQRDDRATRNRQRNLQEFQRGERPTQPRHLAPENRRERREAVQGENPRNHRRMPQQQPPALQRGERRQLTPADRGNNRAVRGEHLVRPRTSAPEDRRERRGAAPRAGQDDQRRHHGRARQQ